MSLVHDYLYNNREVAERSNDGKDQVRDRFIIVTTAEDLFAEEIPAEEHYLYSDFNEVVSDPHTATYSHNKFVKEVKSLQIINFIIKKRNDFIKTKKCITYALPYIYKVKHMLYIFLF